MDTRTASISAQTPLQEYAAGAQQRATRKITEFIAPTVRVPTAHGQFAKWTEQTRLSLPDSVRAIEGRAIEIELQKLDARYDCTAHAIDIPVDIAVGSEMELLLQDGIDLGADIAGIVHLVEVLTKAKSAAGAGVDVTYDVTADPIALIDAEISAIIMAAKAESVAVLFGDAAWRRFKNHPLVSARCAGAPDFSTQPGLFSARASFISCHAFFDASPEGTAEAIQFVLDDEILIFSRSEQPNRRDPSFMKSFRLIGYEQKKETYTRRDGRVVFASVDWCVDSHVTNTAGVRRLNYKAPSETT